MARKKDSPQKAALRELMGNYLKENNVKVKDGTDVNSIMRDMMSIILEGALDQELDEELGYSKYDYRNKETDNSRNGHSQKTLHTSYGDMEIDIPRDRKGDFEPQVVKKYQNSITQDMEEKIIFMYAKGMTTADIESHMRELYDLEISDSTVSRITDKILPIVKEWQERPLESVYAVVFMDAIHFHARNEGRIVKRAVYIAIGIDMEGRKDVLGMYVGQNESAKFWLSILNGLKNRGVEDILIACVDGLTGFPQAIEAVFPQTEIQQCIIHQIRNTMKFVSYKEIKPLMADLKRVYAAPTEEVALAELDSFDEKWSGKYPKIAKSWKDNWANLSTYFKYPEAVRHLIYTTNTIEGFNRQLRKVTKSKTVFPSDDSLLKMLYLAMIDITKKWTGHRQDWGQIHSMVEAALVSINEEVAKSYRDYRNYKQSFVHMMDDVYTKSQSIRYIGDKENANTDSALVATKRSLIFNELNKNLYRKFFMNREELQACKQGYIYVHDQSARLDTINCCLCNVGAVMKGGFEMGNVWYNEPKTLDTAFDVMGDVILSTAAQQYGYLLAVVKLA